MSILTLIAVLCFCLLVNPKVVHRVKNLACSLHLAQHQRSRRNAVPFPLLDLKFLLPKDNLDLVRLLDQSQGLLFLVVKHHYLLLRLLNLLLFPYQALC